MVQGKRVLGSPRSLARSVRSCGAKQFNPGRKLSNYLLFASLLWCILHRAPSQAKVVAFRSSTASLWRAASPELLIEVSSRAGVTPSQYIEAISNQGWGGLPELELWTYAFGLGLSVRTNNGVVRVGSGKGPLLHFANEHYSVQYSPFHSSWSRLSFATRHMSSNLDFLLRRPWQTLSGLQSDNTCLGRGGAPSSSGSNNYYSAMWRLLR
eukprot:919122-Amphidinium_carterae.1